MAIQFRKFLFPKRKLIFPAGILSLVLLPLMGFQVLFSDPYFHPLHVLEIRYANASMQEFLPLNYNSNKIPCITISGNANERKGKIDAVSEKINELRKRDGDASELKINLENEATWADYISILNIFHKKKLKIYIVDATEIWAYADTSYRPVTQHEIDIKSKTSNLVHPFERTMSCGGCFISAPKIPDWNPPQPTTFQLFCQTRGAMSFLGISCLLLMLNFFSIRESFLKNRPKT